MNDVTWCVKGSGCYRELPDGTFRPIRGHDFPAISAEDWRHAAKGPIAPNPVADGIRAHFAGPVLESVIPPVVAAAPCGNDGARGAGVSLPFAKGSPTSEAAAVSMESHAARQRAKVRECIAAARYDGLTDELYDQTRAAGYFAMPQGASATDMTPKFPDQLLPIINMIMEIIDRMGGFDNLLSGRGEPGVRAGVHADTLLKTASPRLRDRALLLERQCASAGGLRFSIMQAKDGKKYWTDGTTPEAIEKTSFTLHDVPDDMTVAVDSHSGSPIFMDDHQQLIAFGIKSGFIDGESALEMLPYPEKELLIQRFKMKQAEQAAMLRQLAEKDPQGFEKLLTHQKGGHK